MKWAALLCVAATSAAADGDVPRTLRMRHLHPRVAQVPPDPSSDSPQPGDDTPTPPVDAAPAQPEPPAPPPEPETPPPPVFSATKQEQTPEVIFVTEPTIEHELVTGRAPVAVVTRADLEA